MQEVVPGILSWSRFHPGIRQTVFSHYVEPARAVIDPMEPEEGLDAFAGREPQLVLLSNRHHYRAARRFVEAFNCRVLCHEAGLHEFGHREPVEGFAWGDEPAPGIRALEVGVLCPEETALHVAVGDGALALADAVIRAGDGELAFVPDFLLGDDPEGVKRGLRRVLGGLARDRGDWDALLLAHGEPLASEGRRALAAFAGAD